MSFFPLHLYLLYSTQNSRKIPSCSPDYQMKKLYPTGAWQLKSIKNWVFQTQRPGCKCWICHLEATWSWKFLKFTESHEWTYSLELLPSKVQNTIEYYSAIKKKQTVPFATTWMTLEGFIPNKSDKDKYHIWYHLYAESKKQNENRLIDTKTKQMVASREGEWNRWRGLRGRNLQL